MTILKMAAIKPGKLLLLTLFYVCCLHGVCDAQTSEIVINFNTKDITVPRRPQLRAGRFVRLRIDNFNWTGKYAITVNKKDSVINIPEPPKLFTALTLGQDFTNLLAGLTDFTSKIPVVSKEDSLKIAASEVNQTLGSTEATKMKLMNFTFGDIIKEIDKGSSAQEGETAFNKNFKIIVKILKRPAVIREQILKDSINKRPESWTQTAPDLLKYKDYFNDPVVTDILLKLSHEEWKKQQKSAQVATVIANIITRKNAIITQHNVFENTVLAPALRNLYDLENNTLAVAAFQAAAVGLLATRQTEVRNFDNLFQAYLDYSVPHADLILADRSLARADSLVLNYRSRFYEFLRKYDSAFNYNTILLASNKATNRTFTYLSLPYQVTKDLTQFDISITPYSGFADMPAYSTSVLLPYRSESFWMFTTGFYISQLADQKFSNKPWKDPATGDTLYNIIKEDVGKTSIGITALLHFGKFISGRDLGWHVAFGPGLSIENKPVPSLLVGGGLCFGKQSRVSLTVGGVFGFVDRLSSAFDMKADYGKAQTDLTVERLKASWFVGFGYSIFGK